MTTYTIIDSDTHVTEPPDVWTSRVPAKFRDRVFRMVRSDAGEDVWLLGDEQVSIAGFSANAGWGRPFPSHPPTLDDCHPGCHDANARLAYMDEVGIWAMVLYPNVAGFGSQKFLTIDDDEMKLACVRAYNDFLRDWVSVDPRRFVTIMSIPYWDVDASVKEVLRGAEAGHRGILFSGKPHALGLPYLGDRHWDPLWAVATECGMPIHFHIGSGDFSTSFNPAKVKAVGAAAAYAFTSVEMFLGNGIQVADLLLSGVLPRFPDLDFVSVESGIGWAPFMLEAVDYSYLEAMEKGQRLWDLMPSDYFKRQVYTCYWFEEIAPRRMLDLLNVDRILFETDFPHPTCLYGNVHERIEAGLGGQPPEVRRKILWENAARLYHVPEP